MKRVLSIGHRNPPTRLARVTDALRSGKPRHYDTSNQELIITVLDAALPRLPLCGDPSTYGC